MTRKLGSLVHWFTGSLGFGYCDVYRFFIVAVHRVSRYNSNLRNVGWNFDCQAAGKRLFVNMRVSQHACAEYIAVFIQNVPAVGVVIPPGIGMEQSDTNLVVVVAQ